MEDLTLCVRVLTQVVIVLIQVAKGDSCVARPAKEVEPLEG